MNHPNDALLAHLLLFTKKNLKLWLPNRDQVSTTPKIAVALKERMTCSTQWDALAAIHN